MIERVIDLTMIIQEGMQTFPVYWHPFVEISQMGRHGIENRETRKLVLGTHTGTHVDAPSHFIPNGMTVDQIPLKYLIGNASVLNLTQFGPNTVVEDEDLKKALGDRNPVRMIMSFGWDRYLGSMAYYDTCPFLSEKAAHWIVEQGCCLLGMDTPMPDNPKNGRGSANDSPNHKILLAGNVILVEYLVNTTKLSDTIDNLVVAPLKILAADGAPARVLAFSVI